MKKNIAIVLFLLFTAFIVCAADETLSNPTISGGASDYGTAGRFIGTATSTNNNLGIGIWRILKRSVTPTTLPQTQRPQLNSVDYNVYQQALVASVRPNVAGDLILKSSTTAISTTTVTDATATIEITVANVTIDLANTAIRAWVGTFSSDAILPTFNVQQLYLSLPGQSYTAGNLSLYANIAQSNQVNFRIENKSNSSQTFILKATETGSTFWRNNYYDNGTDITSSITGNGYEKILAGATKYDSIYAIYTPLQTTSDNLTVDLSFYQEGYPNNAITRQISVIPSTAPEGGSPTSAIGVDPSTGTQKIYFNLPAGESTGLSASSTAEVVVKLYVFNLAGKLVYQKDLSGQVGYNIADVQASLGKGTYVFQIVYNGRIISSGKFVNAN